MDLRSPDDFSLLNTNLHEDDGSIVGKLDLNPVVSKEGVKGYSHGNEVWSGSSSLHAFVRSEKPESPQYEILNEIERTHSYRGIETGVVSGTYSDKSSTPEEAGNLQSEVEMEDSARFSLKFHPEMDNSYQHEDTRENSPHNEVLIGSPDNLSEILQNEKTKTVHIVMEQEEFCGNDTLMEHKYYSEKFSVNNGDIDGRNVDVHAVGHTTKSSVSPVRRISVSPERSPNLHGKVTSSPQDRHKSPYSFRSSRREVPRSPEKSGGNGRKSLSARHTLPSPNRQLRLESPHRDESPWKRISSSPRRHQLSQEPRRSRRSVSRSPSRQRDSSYGSRRDRHDRSRSRSPHARDRYRRSPRRYSSRQRSPAYHSLRRSPRRRPWSPPHNRNNGIGKPGNNLFVAGFSFVTTERDLERKFSRFGRVRDVRIVRDKRSGDSRGFGFLSLERDEDADEAIQALDQTEWNGRVVLVEKSKSR
ncbi:Serine/arginine-rich splicing factor SR45a [Thalictrum thalictroides]|uniref:Serine/arginine-rich splicing factor SR45a n=1 Tax=Thalictrum thalictroides TaxID=46969 RepID=A0A7J6X922_THATH|nr:Serine/arginine-rich splicing factor SR45a [Thalictrum thalictroides]